MQILTIQVSVPRESLRYEDYEEKARCIQQSDLADNDRCEFLKPMADYIAQLLIDDLE